MSDVCKHLGTGGARHLTRVMKLHRCGQHARTMLLTAAIRDGTIIGGSLRAHSCITLRQALGEAAPAYVTAWPACSLLFSRPWDPCLTTLPPLCWCAADAAGMAAGDACAMEFWKDEGSVCRRCSKGCDVCSGGGAQDCTLCVAGYSMFEGACCEFSDLRVAANERRCLCCACKQAPGGAVTGFEAMCGFLVHHHAWHGTPIVNR